MIQRTCFVNLLKDAKKESSEEESEEESSEEEEEEDKTKKDAKPAESKKVSRRTQCILQIHRNLRALAFQNLQHSSMQPHSC